MVLDHLSPLQRIAFLITQALRINTVRKDDRALNIFDRAIDIGAQHKSILRGDALMPGNAHAIAHFRTLVRISGRIHVTILFNVWLGQIRNRITIAYCGCKPMVRMSLPYFS